MTSPDRTRRWTRIGLAVSLLALPAIALAFRRWADPTDPAAVLVREAAMFLAGGLLVLILRRGERCGWEAIGLGGAGVGSTVLWGILGALACAAAVAAVLVASQLIGRPFRGVPDAPLLPPWLFSIVTLRAGILEELCYRGYAIGALGRLGAPRWLAVGLPLLCFAGFHYPLGLAGVAIALMLGAILTALYLWRRNLGANMLAHFLVDFVPNVLLPLLAA
jgi:uncharacterized protein